MLGIKGKDVLKQEENKIQQIHNISKKEEKTICLLIFVKALTWLKTHDKMHGQNKIYKMDFKIK